MKPNLVSAIYELHKKNIRLSPNNSNRASALGSPCERQLVYSRVAWDKAELTSLESQLNFDEGNLHERVVTSELLQAGITIIESQISFIDRPTNITAHLDGVIMTKDADGKEYRFPYEFKTCSPFVFDALSRYKPDEYMKAMSELGASYPWLNKYPAQILTYCFFKEMPTGIILFKNKANGRLLQFEVDLQPNIDYLNEFFERAKRINVTVGKFFGPGGEQIVDPTTKKADEILPAKINDRSECRYCSYKSICLPDIDFGSPLQIKDDPGFEKKLDKYFVFADIAKEYDSINEELKAQCKGVDNVIVGKFHITGKANAKGAWLKTIKAIDANDLLELKAESAKLVELIEKKKGANNADSD